MRAGQPGNQHYALQQKPDNQQQKPNQQQEGRQNQHNALQQQTDKKASTIRKRSHKQIRERQKDVATDASAVYINDRVMKIAAMEEKINKVLSTATCPPPEARQLAGCTAKVVLSIIARPKLLHAMCERSGARQMPPNLDSVKNADAALRRQMKMQ